MSTQVTINPFVSPTQIPGCGLWLDAADKNTLTFQSGNNVSVWTDKSAGIQAQFLTNAMASARFAGNPGSPGATGASNYPVSGSNLNGVNALYFNQAILQAITTQNVNTRSYFLVFQRVSTYTGADIILWPGTWVNSYARGACLVLSDTSQFTFSSQNVANLLNLTVTPSSPMLVSVTFNNGTPGLWDAGGGTTTATGQSVSTLNYLGSTDNYLWIGGVSGLFSTNGFLLGEFIEYNSALNTAQRQQVEGYLAWKWGLQSDLPSNHPYKSSLIPPLLNPPRSLPTVIQNPTSAFLPTQISGCTLWLDGSDSTTVIRSGTTITQWKDKSGLLNHTTATGGVSTYTANAINGLSAPYLNNTWLTGPFATAYTGNTVQAFAVATLVSTSGSYGRILSLGRPGVNDFNSGNTTFMFIRNNGGQSLIIGRNGSYLSANIPAYSTPFLVQSSQNVNIESIGVNGILTPATQNTGQLGNFNITSYGIGTNTATSDATYWQGYIGEVIYYTGVLTTTQRQQVEGYLAWKWGLQANLPSDHPYKLAAPAGIASSLTSLRSVMTFASWQPTLISGCTLWLDPTDLTTFTFSGLNITQWRDKSTTAAVFTGVNNPVLSSTRYSGNRPISFGGTAYFQNTTFTYTTSNRSAFFVFDETTEQTHVGVLSFASSGTDWNQLNTMVYETGSKPTQYLQVAQSHTNGGYAMTIQSSTIGFALYSDTFGSGRETAYVNGSQTGTTTSVAGFTNSTGLVIGARMASGSVGNQLIGVIGEIILYNRPLLTAERQQVEGYLAWKWGLVSSLPSNHPYKKWPPSP